MFIKLVYSLDQMVKLITDRKTFRSALNSLLSVQIILPWHTVISQMNSIRMEFISFPILSIKLLHTGDKRIVTLAINT